MVSRIKKTLLWVSLVAAFAVGGAAVSGAATSKSKSASSKAQAAAMPAHGSAAHEKAETAVTGDAATKAQAAAVASVGSGSTAGDVTTDFRGDGYEVTVTKSDGTTVEVHLDGSFDVLQFPGPGGPPPGGSGA